MLRPELGQLTQRIARLPLDARGYPVPWFVQWINGAPEFRVMDGEKFARAIRERRCWVCGDVLGRHLAFVIGPMCALNKTSAEPPSHHDCAVWSAQHCPFLSRPHMVRREDELTDTCTKGDAAIMRNPGACGVWTTTAYRLHRSPGNSATGYLIEMGDPDRVEWFAAGRPATRAEVEASIDSGLPLLLEAVDRESGLSDRAAARLALVERRAAIDVLLPTASDGRVQEATPHV